MEYEVLAFPWPNGVRSWPIRVLRLKLSDSGRGHPPGPRVPMLRLFVLDSSTPVHSVSQELQSARSFAPAATVGAALWAGLRVRCLQVGSRRERRWSLGVNEITGRSVRECTLESW